MNKKFAILFIIVIAASVILSVIAFTTEPDALDVNLTVVTTPEQEEAVWPPTIHNPMDDIIPLPETPNIAEGKPVDASSFVFEYTPSNAVDGVLTTYWESQGFPAELTIDLQGGHTIQTIAVGLNPSLMWEARSQAFEIQTSTDGNTFSAVVPNTMHEFDPTTGNTVRIDFAPTAANYVRLIFTANTAARTEGAQAAEIMIFE